MTVSESSQPNHQPARRSRSKRLLLPYAILVLGLCFTFLVSFYFSKMANAQDQSRFRNYLQLILSHGGGFFPYHAGRFDIIYSNLAQTREHLAQPPSTYLRRFYYDTIVHHPTALQFLCTMVGSDHLLLGTDYPFPVADPDPLRLYAQAGFSAADTAAVAGGNAQTLFHLQGA